VAAMGRGAQRTPAYQEAMAWRADGKAKNGLYLYGPPGSGKTGLATALFNRTMQDGDTYGLWVEWYNFVAGVQSKYGAGDGGAEKALMLAQTVPLLLLDDAGDVARSVESEDKQLLMFRVVNDRHGANNKPVLMTSNLSPEKFVLQYGLRTWRRVEERCAVVKLELLAERGTPWLQK